MFNNAIPYTITENLDLSKLAEKLREYSSREPGAVEFGTIGFVAPDMNYPDRIFIDALGVQFIRLKTIEKVLPSAAVNERFAKELAELEAKESRKLSRKEKLALKEEIIFSMLPVAFTKSSYTECFIDQEAGLLVVNASSFSKAETLLSLLRKALGSLAIKPINTVQKITNVLTDWPRPGSLEIPENFSLGGKYSLNYSDDSKKAKLVDFDLNSELIDMIDNGAKVSLLSLSYKELVDFVITDEFVLKQIKYIGTIEDNEDENQFEADAILTSSTLVELIDILIYSFGGES